MPPRSSPSQSGSSPFPFLEGRGAAAGEAELSLPLGQRLLRAGLISQSQLAQALREQQQNHLKLGEVCLEHGWLTPSDLYRFLPSQALSLGEILVALGYLDFEQLRVALAQQRRYGRKLGEILTWKGWVQPAILDRALDVQVQLQRMASPNAWEALQPFLARDPLQAPQMSPQEAVVQRSPAEEVARGSGTESSLSCQGAELFPVVHPSDPARDPLPGTAAGGRESSSAAEDPSASVAQPATLADYRKQVEALQLQIELQEREWDRILADMNQQIADFQSQYQQRIQKLEATIRQQQEELQHQARLQQDLQVWREHLQRLERELALARAAEQKAQRQLQTQRDCYQSELEHLREQIQILQERQLDSVPSSVVADLRAQLQAALDQVRQLQSERDQLQAQLAQPAASSGEAADPLLRQVATLEEQVAELKAAVQSWQERYAQLQQEHETQMARLSSYVPPEQVENLQAQLRQLQAEVAQLTAANHEAAARLAQQEEQLQQSQVLVLQLRAERAEADQRIAQLEGFLQARQEALEQAQQQLKSLGSRLRALQQQQAKLTVELRDAQELLAAYRQSLESLQESLKAEQDRNRLLRVSYEQQKLIAEAAQAQLRAANLPTNPGERPTCSSEMGRAAARPTVRVSKAESLPEEPAPSEEEVPADPLLAELTPWARRLFQNLQEAGLLDRPQVEHILSRWQQAGGKLTTVIGECTGLKATTIKFFADEGYSARLSGCRTLGDFLKAADLVPAEVLESLPPMDEASPDWGDPLVERGLLRAETVQYFRQHFLTVSAKD